MRKSIGFRLGHPTWYSCCLLLFSIAGPLYGQEAPPLEIGSPVGGGVRQGNAPPGNVPQEFFVVGRLERVRRNDTGATRFALIDDQGQVAAFVAPTARFDLRRHMGQEIGVSAKSFSQSDGSPPYVIVETITPMFARNSAPAARSEVAPPPQPGPLPPPRPDAGAIRTVAHEEMIVEDDWAVVGDGHVGSYTSGSVCQACTGSGCESCEPYHGSSCHLPDCNVCRPDPPTCGPPGWLWVRGEYLLWWTKGMAIPPLITTSDAGTSAANAGVLGLDSTEILYGNQSILENDSSGFRIRFGGFFGPQRKLGYEAEYFGFSGNTENFEISSDGSGNPILARPFFNINPRQDGDGDLNPPAGEDSELVSYPGVLGGTITVDSFSELQSAAGRLRWNICCQKRCDPCGSGCTYCGHPPFSRIDLLAGYRYYNLKEGLSINEDLMSLQATNPGTFDITDSFATRNDFHGAELGVSWESGWNRWTLELMMNIALGSTQQDVTIDGETTIAPLVAPAETFDGGLLAQRSNMGTYSRNEFAMIPQINTNLSFYMTPRLRAVLGYTLLYWGSVARPGDQIDLDLNPDLLPPEFEPFVGPLRPEFVFRESDFWAQGLNVGLDYRW